MIGKVTLFMWCVVYCNPGPHLVLCVCTGQCGSRHPSGRWWNTSAWPGGCWEGRCSWSPGGRPGWTSHLAGAGGRSLGQSWEVGPRSTLRSPRLSWTSGPPCWPRTWSSLPSPGWQPWAGPSCRRTSPGRPPCRTPRTAGPGAGLAVWTCTAQRQHSPLSPHYWSLSHL